MAPRTSRLQVLGDITRQVNYKEGSLQYAPKFKVTCIFNVLQQSASTIGVHDRGMLLLLSMLQQSLLQQRLEFDFCKVKCYSNPFRN